MHKVRQYVVPVNREPLYIVSKSVIGCLSGKRDAICTSEPPTHSGKGNEWEPGRSPTLSAPGVPGHASSPTVDAEANHGSRLASVDGVGVAVRNTPDCGLRERARVRLESRRAAV